MTRRLLIALLALALGSTLWAKPVDAKLALKVAQNYWNQQPDTRKGAVLKNATPGSQLRNLYVFVAPEGGFVIVAADDIARPILGFSPKGRIGDTINPGCLYWLGTYESQISWARSHDLRPSESTTQAWAALAEDTPRRQDQTSTPPLPHVDPLMTTEWGQGGCAGALTTRSQAHYNKYCPEDAGVSNFSGLAGRCPTGCTATAMAQIMKYWNHPASGTGLTGQYEDGHHHTIPNVDLSVWTYDWNNMPNALTRNSTATEEDEVAMLIYHCAIAMHSDFGPSETEAISASNIFIEYSAEKAFVNNFGYKSSLHSIYRSDYETQQWEAILIQELNANRPILYSGHEEGHNNANGRFVSGGHAFVFDGYRMTNSIDYQFHVNWGWRGDADGWFLSTALSPESSGTGSSERNEYNYLQDIVIGIEPCTTNAGTVLINLSTQDATKGRTEGGGQYSTGSDVTIRAMANSGYRFDRWSDGSKANPRQFRVNTNQSLIAFFKSVNANNQLRYDCGATSSSTTLAQERCCAVKYSNSDFGNFAYVAALEAIFHSGGHVQMSLYQGDDAPTIKIYEESVYVNPASAFVPTVIDIPNYVAIDPQQPLWIIAKSTNPSTATALGVSSFPGTTSSYSSNYGVNCLSQEQNISYILRANLTNTAPSGYTNVIGLNATAITDNSISIRWTPSSNEDAWMVQYRAKGTASYSTLVVAHTDITIPNLDPLTEYEIRVSPYNVLMPGAGLRWASGEWCTLACQGAASAGNRGDRNILDAYGLGRATCDNSFIQTIINADELASLATAPSVVGMRYYALLSEGSSYFNNCTIYMQNTQRTTFASATDFDMLSSEWTQVYHGSLNQTASGWQLVQFDTPFEWDGQSNVIMAVLRQNGSRSTVDVPFGSYVTTGRNQTFYAQYNNTNLNWAQPIPQQVMAESSIRDIRPALQFIGCSGNCHNADFEWSMRANRRDEILACEGHIYDNGGSAMWYAPNQNSTLVVRPCEEGNAVSLSGTVNLQPSDHLRIYNGVGTGGVLLADLSGNNNTHTYRSDDRSGALTLQFVTGAPISDNASGVEYNPAGFALAISCGQHSCVRPSDITSTHISNGMTISWQPGGNENSWQVLCVEEGHRASESTLHTVTGSPQLTILDMSSSTNYDVYVRSLCSDNEHSGWAHASVTSPVTMPGTLCYWFDEDSVRHYINLGNGEYHIDASGLDYGIHTFHCQIIDNQGSAYAIYSETFFKEFDVERDASTLAYWFDEESTRRFATVNGGEVDYRFDVSHLDYGIHTFHCQLVDNTGIDYPIYSEQFFKDFDVERDATTLAYWFDEESTRRFATVNGGEVDYQFDVSHLDYGIHTFHCQLVDNTGIDYPIYSEQFFKDFDVERDATTLAYWFDEESTRRFATVNGGEVDYQFDVSHLDYGIHTFHCQLIDNDGQFYTIYSELFFKEHSANEGVTEVIYWFDDPSLPFGSSDETRPESKSGNSSSIRYTTTSYAPDIAIPAGEMECGQHTLYLMNASGPVSVFSSQFYYEDSICCLPPIGIGVDDITASSARIHWDNQADTFMVFISPTDFNPDTCTHATRVYGSEYFATGLNDLSFYHYAVRAVCDNSDTAWQTGTFVTLPTDCQRLYVSTNGNFNNRGLSWAESINDLSQALYRAELMRIYYGHTPEVWVAEGDYQLNQQQFPVVGCQLLGGFAGNEPENYDPDLRDIVQHPSRIGGFIQNHSFDTLQPSIIDGFYLTQPSTLFNNTILQHCYLTNINSSTPLLTLSGATVSYCLLANNNTHGPIVNLYNGATMDHCDVVKNNCGNGAAVVGRSRPYEFDSQVRNSILWNNNATTQADGTLVLIQNALQDQYEANNIDVAAENWGDFGFQDHCLFACVENNDFHLLPSSPLIDRASGSFAGRDIEGNLPWGNLADIGCFEYTGQIVNTNPVARIDSIGLDFVQISFDSTQGNRIWIAFDSVPFAPQNHSNLTQTTESTYRFTHLTPGKTYYYSIRSECNSDHWSTIQEIRPLTIVYDTLRVCVKYNLVVVPNNPNLGKCAGEGRFPMGSEVQIMAIPNRETRFVQWSDGNTQNPRIVVMEHDLTFTAIFQ